MNVGDFDSDGNIVHHVKIIKGTDMKWMHFIEPPMVRRILDFIEGEDFNTSELGITEQMIKLVTSKRLEWIKKFGRY